MSIPKVFFRCREDINCLELFLKGKGCRYKKCSFCSYPEEALTERISADLWKKVLAEFLTTLPDRDFKEIFIYNYGNVLDEDNLPSDVFYWLLEKLKGRYRNLKLLSFDNRIEEEFGFRKDKLKKVKKILAPVVPEVAIGYETSNPFIRNVLLRKKLEEDDFLKALNLLSELGFKVRIYLLFPQFPTFSFQKAISQLEKDILHLLEVKKTFSVSMRIHVCLLKIKKGTHLFSLVNGKIPSLSLVKDHKLKEEFSMILRKFPVESILSLDAS
jgi:radical SAM enzyme (TIGR01210 family)